MRNLNGFQIAYIIIYVLKMIQLVIDYYNVSNNIKNMDSLRITNSLQTINDKTHLRILRYSMLGWTCSAIWCLNV